MMKLPFWITASIALCVLAGHAARPATGANASKPAEARKLVVDLRNADIDWDGNYIGLHPRIKGDPAKKLLALGKAVVPALRRALADPKRFAAAHVLLTRIELKTYPITGGQWNGLSVKLFADGRQQVMPGQQKAILAQWKKYFEAR